MRNTETIYAEGSTEDFRNLLVSGRNVKVTTLDGREDPGHFCEVHGYISPEGSLVFKVTLLDEASDYPRQHLVSKFIDCT